MSAGAAVKLDGVGKAYPRDRNPLQILWGQLWRNTKGNRFWAVRNVNAEISKGDAIGIVGRNGSGKSTLLQLICGTLKPSEGDVSVNGKIAAMLELGVGFNEDFTGRENVYLYASAFGLSNEDVTDRLPEIEAFAGIGEYFDRAVREYSSGMYARLAFAVCVHLDSEILVVDEILAVGDAAFQKNCQRRMRQFSETGTLLFVSHDPAAVTATCSKAILLENGEATATGSADMVMRQYVDSLYDLDENAQNSEQKPKQERATRECVTTSKVQSFPIHVEPFNADSVAHGFGGCEIIECGFTDDAGAVVSEVSAGQPVNFQIVAIAERDINRPVAGFIFRNEYGQNLFGDNTYLEYREQPITTKAGQLLVARFKFVMPYLPNGRYTFAPSIIEGTQAEHIHLDWREDALVLTVRNSDIAHGKVGVKPDRIMYR